MRAILSTYKSKFVMSVESTCSYNCPKHNETGALFESLWFDPLPRWTETLIDKINVGGGAAGDFRYPNAGVFAGEAG